MSFMIHSRHELADMSIVYQLDEATRMIGMLIYPTHLTDRLATRRTRLSDGPEYAHLPGWSMPALEVDPLVQVKWIGAEPTWGFGQGRTMRGSQASYEMKLDHQATRSEGDFIRISTFLRSTDGYMCEHRLGWRKGDLFLTVTTVFYNESTNPVAVELLSSFALGGITPFAADDAPDRLLLHRFRSNWSAEGRLDTQSVEQLNLERSWSGHGVRCERFGQVGSMPTNGYFPFIGIEDKPMGVLWGAQLAWAGSWQMEAYRRDDSLSISGGLADREFGHWMKVIKPGESFEAPPATLTTVEGDLDLLCHRLTSAQQRAADAALVVEADLPIVFNEWCTSWGRPSHENLIAIADRIQGTPIRYLVIDAGWYAPMDGEWSSAQGDWQPNPTLYPQGLIATAQAIRDRGLIPGIWFELEVTGPSAEAFRQVEHLLRRDGMTLTVGGRRFWNMNDPYVIDYLSRRVIGLLRDTGMGYLKVDYNETLGMGVDGAESLGEGLRQQIQGVYRFFERIHQELPELVIENCSSGGHRLEPSMMSRCAMGSFSDAHETREIPIIAANLHRLILPRQSQIWAVLRKTDDDRRLLYLLNATFLGRMCLSGDIKELNDHQWELALRAQSVYQQVAPIIKDGRSYRLGPAVSSYRHPHGWQAVVRVATDRNQALVVAHSFGAEVPPYVDVELPQGNWNIADKLLINAGACDLADGRLRIPFGGEFDSAVVHLVK